MYIDVVHTHIYTYDRGERERNPHVRSGDRDQVRDVREFLSGGKAGRGLCLLGSVPAYAIIKIISVYRAFSHRYIPGPRDISPRASRNIKLNSRYIAATLLFFVC